MAKRFAIRRSEHAKEDGPLTFDQLRERFAKGEIKASDYVRDFDVHPAKWSRIEKNTKLFARLSQSGGTVPRTAAPGSRGIVDSSPVLASGPISTAPPAGAREGRFRGEFVSLSLASIAILLTLLNSGWLFITNADADEPVNTKTKQLENIGDGNNASHPLEKPVATLDDIVKRLETIDRQIAETRQHTQAQDDIVTRLDTIDGRIAEIGQRAETQASGNLLRKAMEAGSLEFSVGDTPFRFIFVPAGTFRFGYPVEEQNRVVRATGNPNSFLNATPESTVKVTRGFFMLDREVTVAQWTSCMKEAAAEPAPASINGKQTAVDAPKRNVSWQEAQAFCAALQQAASGLSDTTCQVRLPTEIEWEYAARGSQSLYFPWVPQAGVEQRFLGSAEGSTAPVIVDALKNQDISWRGQFDFAGNLAEWCLDPYDRSLHKALAERQADSVVEYEPANDPLVQAALAGRNGEGNPSRTLRGGSILDPPQACELPMRRFLLQNKYADHIGFRPVIVLKKAVASQTKDNP